ncbi:hypothetical protein M8C21_017452 [Ambrosia artemisiifolia]|uniref:Uncharacterized protein n=1 Tax=Ambrosia artemisiifolia TaxID=4212 RepID=A0AAD5GYF2_AMBAR|nr:hypothetical protein M8C21_017452 [Ambrosia artemisiifolia]
MWVLFSVDFEKKADDENFDGRGRQRRRIYKGKYIKFFCTYVRLGLPNPSQHNNLLLFLKLYDNKNRLLGLGFSDGMGGGELCDCGGDDSEERQLYTILQGLRLRSAVGGRLRNSSKLIDTPGRCKATLPFSKTGKLMESLVVVVVGD